MMQKLKFIIEIVANILFGGTPALMLYVSHHPDKDSIHIQSMYNIDCPDLAKDSYQAAQRHLMQYKDLDEDGKKHNDRT